tara:strand:+ start:930 stop:1070 length:141 start_codon:yes stop_codon:yes gene_type:complete
LLNRYQPEPEKAASAAFFYAKPVLMVEIAPIHVIYFHFQVTIFKIK